MGRSLIFQPMDTSLLTSFCLTLFRELYEQDIWPN